MSEIPAVTSSSVLARPGAVRSPDDGPDRGTAWHYGDPFGEQRATATTAAVIDRSTRFVIAITGEERLTWLNTISSQQVATLTDGSSAENLSLDVNGRVEHHMVMTDIDGTTWIDTEADRGPDLLAFLTKMVFWSKAAPRRGSELVVLSLLGPKAPSILRAVGTEVPDAAYQATLLVPGDPSSGFVRRMPWPARVDSFDVLVPAASLDEWWAKFVVAGAREAGSWAFEALRVESGRPRIGLDTDDRTIPHEVGWIGGVTEFGAVHLDKGCYRGQETVARVHNLGKPPRRLVLLHLDGSADGRPETGDDVTVGGRAVGRLGTVVDHFELGPIALAQIKRAVPVDTTLDAGPCAASIDPESYTADTAVQAGRAAVDRLRGR
ncbi:glycine cleavage system protein T [Rhodococcus sp. Leaf7]|uniref:CAF17-like 4Fe-4S cluster assembly/insertion protein YgfZ n=1 Tax=unclassified Rhodococcus (in: high G+C Gram-positive bacteria) TaxID=192944 RepID=UPI0006FC3B33|nr:MULTISPECIES: folate-binding protein YgfZ [unclassified Rhodococcus (in: high G+C Gram-positive bacteria)]KQU06884.1 glycine cleavage system protein T [Rhodococcus sp. Leaf7]KQU42403.1 glycine cleavage system protein T [Rhodococcus sp. Leaf247]